MWILPRPSLSRIYSEVHPIQLLRVHSGVRRRSSSGALFTFPAFLANSLHPPLVFLGDIQNQFCVPSSLSVSAFVPTQSSSVGATSGPTNEKLGFGI